MLRAFRSAPPRRAVWPRLVVLLLLIALTMTGCRHQFSGSVFNTPPPAPDFTLTDHNGQPFRLSDQRGHVTLLYFGYTTCPDICPADVARLAAVKRALGDEAAGLRVAMITVDPERDSAQVMRDYLARFDASFLGLRGTPEELAAVYKPYGVYAQRRDVPGSAIVYVMDHTATVYLIDKAGRWRGLFDHELSAEEVTGDVRAVLRERLPQS